MTRILGFVAYLFGVAAGIALVLMVCFGVGVLLGIVALGFQAVVR